MNTWTTCAWLWMYAGAFLMLLELLAPGFIVFFFGLSAATVGLLRFALGDTLTGTWQMIAFSVFTIIYLVGLRRLLKGLFMGTREASGTDFEHETIGRTGKVVQAIRTGLAGRVLIGDAEWTAVADTEIAAGTDVKVVAQSNLTMKVEAI